MGSSEKVYFRFGKLKYKVEMKNSEGKVVCCCSIVEIEKQLADEK